MQKTIIKSLFVLGVLLCVAEGTKGKRRGFRGYGRGMATYGGTVQTGIYVPAIPSGSGYRTVAGPSGGANGIEQPPMALSYRSLPYGGGMFGPTDASYQAASSRIPSEYSSQFFQSYTPSVSAGQQIYTDTLHEEHYNPSTPSTYEQSYIQAAALTHEYNYAAPAAYYDQGQNSPTSSYDQIYSQPTDATYTPTELIEYSAMPTYE